MEAVHEWALERARSGTRIAQRAEQFGPALLDQPSEGGAGKSQAERGGSGERVNNISHGAEAHDQQTIESMRGSSKRRVCHPNGSWLVAARADIPGPAHDFCGFNRARAAMIPVAE